MPESPDCHDLNDEVFLQQAEALCRGRGATLTPIRREVLGHLRRASGGLKAYDLLDLIKRTHPGATPPTVYRALDFLIDQRLAHKVGSVNQFIACNQQHHEHIGLFVVCPECGKVSELADEAMVHALAHSLKTAGHRLVGSEIELSAVCGKCNLGQLSDCRGTPDPGSDSVQ